MGPAAPSETSEDVLASIRRLVAEESGVPTPLAAAPESSETAFAEAEFVDDTAPSEASAERAQSEAEEGLRDDVDAAHTSAHIRPRPPAPQATQTTPEPQEAPQPAADLNPQAPVLSKADHERRIAVFHEIRRQYDERRALREAERREEESSDPEMCKLLLTEDFRVRGPEVEVVSHPVAPASRLGYTEDSDFPEEEAELSLESVVREAVSESVRDALQGHSLDDEDEEGGFLDESEDAFIDAETLRTLVVNIVHEELRGALGEQISARVRKLVRQEINRALQLDRLRY